MCLDVNGYFKFVATCRLNGLKRLQAKMSSGNLSALKTLSKSVDDEIEALEKEVNYGLTVAPSKFSADIADEVLEEVNDMNKGADGNYNRSTWNPGI